MSDQALQIPIHTTGASTITLTIHPESKGDTLTAINEAEATEHSEARYQLKEGCSYEYEFDSRDYQLEELPPIVKPSKSANSAGGRIVPNIYVGTMSLNVLHKDSHTICGTVKLEVRSSKTSYRQDYRHMLEEIAEKCIGLITQYTSPATQTFTQNYAADPDTRYQQFAFIRSIIGSADFASAIHRIITAPVTTWATINKQTDIRRSGRLTSNSMKQIASSSNRIPLSPTHPLKHPSITSIPSRIRTQDKHDTPDTPENRFVKYVLTTFYDFCAQTRAQMKSDSREYAEASQLEKELENHLRHPLFKEVSQPDTLPINSPVLQRKAGYREILRAWLMFELASQLTWDGGEDVYAAGKRDVATLYEYWLFFKLLDLLQEIFTIEPTSIDNLIETTNDKLGLKLKSGKHIPLRGTYEQGPRKLNFQFGYNRTFSGEQEYPASGSWSKSMRPDYTLSLWPAEFNALQAETQELIIHIHFDAKYKVQYITENFAPKDDSNESEEELLNDVKTSEKEGVYKRADLLKMHAYKDAIRRTVGAYVLYPGSEKLTRQGFHEIIPGLGAFPISPSHTNDGTQHLKQFILDVIEHTFDRASQHEQLTYHVYEVHKDKKEFEVKETLPEFNYDTHNKRAHPPSETTVLIGFCKGDEHRQWISKKGLYNTRAGSGRGSLPLAPQETGASYLLLHQEGHLESGDLWRITVRGPKIFSKTDLLKREYPTKPTTDFYLVYQVEKVEDVAFSGVKWDIRKLEKFKTHRESGKPFAVTLTELMSAKIAN